MSIVLMESFEGVSTIAQLAGVAASDATTKWQSDATPATNFSLVGGKLKVLTATKHYIGRTLGSSLTTVVFGIKYTPSAVNTTRMMMALDTILGNGNLELFRDTSEIGIKAANTFLGETSGLGLAAGVEVAVEVKAVHVSGNNWTVNVRVGGVVVLTLTNQNFGSSTFSKISFGEALINTNQVDDLFSDLYVDDTDFLAGAGAWSVQCIRPDGAGAHTDWVPDSGSNYARVNEQNVNDASYVQATNDNDEDTYTYDNPTHVSGHSVRAVQVCSRAAYLAGAKNLAHVERNGSGTEADGSNQALTAALGYVGTVFNTQADGSAWGSFNDLDSYQFGRKQKA